MAKHDDPTALRPLYPVALTRLMRNNGLLLMFAMALFFVLNQGPLWKALSAAGFLAGAGMTACGAHRLRHPGPPQYVLTPEGLFIHIPGAVEVMVPWSEVKGVFLSDTPVAFENAPLPLLGKYRNLVLILISKAFYDNHIHVGSLGQRGPGWSNTFIPWNGQICIALHSKLLGTDPAQLLQAVDSRWRLFAPRSLSDVTEGGQTTAPH